MLASAGRGSSARRATVPYCCGKAIFWARLLHGPSERLRRPRPACLACEAEAEVVHHSGGCSERGGRACRHEATSMWPSRFPFGRRRVGRRDVGLEGGGAQSLLIELTRLPECLPPRLLISGHRHVEGPGWAGQSGCFEGVKRIDDRRWAFFALASATAVVCCFCSADWTAPKGAEHALRPRGCAGCCPLRRRLAPDYGRDGRAAARPDGGRVATRDLRNARALRGKFFRAVGSLPPQRWLQP